MERHAGAHTKRVRAPLAEVFSVPDGVEMVDLGGQVAHESLYIISRNQLDRGRARGPIDRQGCNVGPQARIQDGETLETL